MFPPCFVARLLLCGESKKCVEQMLPPMRLSTDDWWTNWYPKHFQEVSKTFPKGFETLPKLVLKPFLKHTCMKNAKILTLNRWLMNQQISKTFLELVDIQNISKRFWNISKLFPNKSKTIVKALPQAYFWKVPKYCHPWDSQEMADELADISKLFPRGFPKHLLKPFLIPQVSSMFRKNAQILWNWLLSQNWIIPASFLELYEACDEFCFMFDNKMYVSGSF